MQPLNENKCGIKCEWMQTKRLLINPDGQVLPCCFFANVIYMYDRMGAPESWKPKDEYGISDQLMDVPRVAYETSKEGILMDYYKNKKEYNIFENDIEDIINSEWFAQTLPQSWDDEDTLAKQCKTYCQIKDE